MEIINVNIHYLITFAALFFITYIVMGRWLVAPIIEVLRKREKLSTGASQEAAELREKALQIMEEVNTRLNEARKMAQEKARLIIEEATKKEREIVNSAREEVRETIESLRKSISTEMETVRSELLGQVDRMALWIAEKILERKVA